MAKIVTFVAVIALGIGFIIALAASKIHRDRETLEVENINDKLDEFRDTIEAAVLTKDEYKALQKKHKQEEKQERKQRKARLKLGEDEPFKPRIFIVRFEGDMHASEVENLRDAITTILSVAKEMDEVLVIIDSPGGVVHNYGLAASQLVRVKQKNIKLTVAVDLIAASGGYMMACVADQILAAPFAVLGSIGVLAEVPNFYSLLKKHEIDIEHHTAGEYKSTLNILAKNTDKGREKFKEELQDIHVLFKQFVHANRPSLDINKIATGEAWYGSKALELGLVDALKTSDDYIVEKAANCDVYEVSIQVPETLKRKLSSLLYNAFNVAITRIFYKFTQKHNYVA